MIQFKLFYTFVPATLYCAKRRSMPNPVHLLLPKQTPQLYIRKEWKQEMGKEKAKEKEKETAAKSSMVIVRTGQIHTDQAAHCTGTWA